MGCPASHVAAAADELHAASESLEEAVSEMVRDMVGEYVANEIADYLSYNITLVDPDEFTQLQEDVDNHYSSRITAPEVRNLILAVLKEQRSRSRFARMWEGVRSSFLRVKHRVLRRQ
jgi:uncharacterized protein YpuA (DUF1002 family)